MRDALAARAGRTWRPWTVRVPATLAPVSSVLFVVADGFAGVMGSWDTPMPGLWWVRVGIIGHCVLAALAIVLLVVGMRSASWRRTAAISAWMIIPVGFGWLVLVGRLISGS